MSGFGRKGVVGRAPEARPQNLTTPPQGLGFNREPHRHNPVLPERSTAQTNGQFSDARAAFLASERQRQNQFGNPTATSQAQAHAPRSEQRYTASGYHGDISTRTPYSGISSRKKSMLTAYLLWLFFSNLSAHRFYIGGPKLALPQLGCLVGGVVLLFIGLAVGLAALASIPFFFWMLWVLGDAFFIPGMCRRAGQPESAREMANHFA